MTIAMVSKVEGNQIRYKSLKLKKGKKVNKFSEIPEEATLEIKDEKEIVNLLKILEIPETEKDKVKFFNT